MRTTTSDELTSDELTCDGCEFTEPETSAVGWVQIDVTGIDTRTMDDPAGPLHACSIVCAATATSRLSPVPLAPLARIIQYP